MDDRRQPASLRPPPAPRSPSPAVAALLSAVIPGTGQLLSGERRRGLILLGITGGMLLAAALFYLQGQIFVARLLVQPTFLKALLVVNAAVLAFRAFAAADAWYAALPGAKRTSFTHRVTGAVVVAAITLGVLLIPHAAFGYYDVVAQDTLVSIFAEDEPADPDPPAEAVPTLVGGAAATTSTTTPVLWEGKERLNVVLLGGDAGAGRNGIRTDTIIVVSIDPETGWAAMFSLPRNVVKVPLPDGIEIEGCNCWPSLINELYPYGLQHPELFPGGSDPGATALKAALGELLGIPIHHYALVNLDGFVSVIDALGGVSINVQEPVHDDEYPHEDGTTIVVDIPAGVQHMDGHTALAYARSRRESDDYNRMGRQRCVLEAAAEQADPARLLLAFPTLAGILRDNLETDIPLDQLPDLVELAAEVDTTQIVSIPIVPPAYNAGWENRYPYPDVPLIRSHVQIAIEQPPALAIAQLGLEPLGEACG